ncbi:hypothetical protein [Aquimarina aggregata]|uniref:hypothetical protein n=1 Tax=Aquimarina aggregata TaxID=1642818 RepID=UPI002491892C|nr:hypothetical protein [Aquimarina aggregata]
MDEYKVGDKKPIKSRVSIQTQGVPRVHRELIRSEIVEGGIDYEQNPEIEKIVLNPYDGFKQSGWKEITKQVIQGYTLYVSTIVGFPGVKNKTIFNRLVNQAKASYVLELKDGIDEGHYKVAFTTSSFFSIKACFLYSEIKLT